MIKIIIVDDQRIIRRGLQALLVDDKELEVIGLAENALQARALLNTLEPDVLLLELGRATKDGFRLLNQLYQHQNQANSESQKTAIAKASPLATKPAIVILASLADEISVTRALAMGASGYLLKNMAEAKLCQSIKLACLTRQLVLAPEIVELLIVNSAELTPAVDGVTEPGSELVPTNALALDHLLETAFANFGSI